MAVEPCFGYDNNSLRLSDTYMYQETQLSLFQIIICHLYGAMMIMHIQLQGPANHYKSACITG